MTEKSNVGIFNPRRLAHVNLWGHGHDRIAQFYRNVVGIEEAYRRDAISAIFMSNGNTYHDFAIMDLSSPRGAGNSAGLHHIAFELENEFELVRGYENALATGYNFDFTISADVTNSAYGSDPDGNRFEVYADVKPDWRSQRSGEVASGAHPWTPGETPPKQESFYEADPKIEVVEEAVFHPIRVSHAVLVAKNYPAMVEHYSALVGLRVLEGGREDAFAVLGGSLGEESLTIFRSRGYRKPGLHHFGFELPSVDELERSLRRLRESDLEIVVETDHPTRRSVFIRDPSGELLQFYVNGDQDFESWGEAGEEVALFLA